MAGDSKLNARWYEGPEGLRELEADWLTLTRDADLFARFEWNLAAAMYLIPDGEKIWFCRISDLAGRPLAIIPAVTGNETVKPFGQLSALSLGWDPQQATFEFPMASNADAQKIGSAMLRAFKELPFKWRVISWARVMANGNAAKVARALGPRWTDIKEASDCFTFCTADEPDSAQGLELYAVKSSKLKSKLAYTTRRLSAQGPLEMRLARTDGDIRAYFEEFLRLESSGWKGAHGTGTALALVPSAKSFFSSLIDQSNADFEADIVLLFCGAKAVAGQYVLRTARSEHLYKIAYDESFAALSPGQILHLQVLEHAKSSDAIDRVSWVTGQNWMKEWGPFPEPTLQIHIFRSPWQASLVRTGRNARRRVRHLLEHLPTKKAKGETPPDGKHSRQ